MAGLEAKEGYACGGFHRGAADLAGFAVDAGGNVDREHRAPCPLEGVDPFDDRFRFAIDVAREARAEQSVDHAISLGEVDRTGVEDRAGPASGGERRIAFQGIAAAEQSELDRIAALTEQPAGDEAVAAVAARAADDGDPAARFREPHRFVGDCETRPLHQLNARRSGRNRKAVGLAHFGGRQEFRERQRVKHQRRLRATWPKRKRQKRAFHRVGFCYIPPTLIPDSSAGRAFDC